MVNSPLKSALANSENLQSSVSRLEINFRWATGFMNEYARGDFENPFEQATGFMNEYAHEDFKNPFEQATGFLSGYETGGSENTY